MRPWLPKARKMYDEERLSYTKIAQALGLNRSTVFRALNPEYNRARRRREEALARAAKYGPLTGLTNHT